MTAATIDTTTVTVLMLPIDQLSIGLDFRLDDDPDDVAELAVSISELGVLQPLVVRQIVDGWEVVAGRRRLTAARVVGLDVVPCVLRSMSDDEAADVALAENLHRRNLSPVEEGLAFARLRDQGLTQTQIGERVGRSQTHVSMLLRVLELPAEFRQKVHRREMSYVTALDRAKRPEARRGGVSTHGKLTGTDAEIVSHWRRRHDRLLAGIAAVLKANPKSVHEFHELLERLFALDRKPLVEEEHTKPRAR